MLRLNSSLWFLTVNLLGLDSIFQRHSKCHYEIYCKKKKKKKKVAHTHTHTHKRTHAYTISPTHARSHTPSRAHGLASSPISAHTCFLSASALTPCVFRAAGLPPPSTANCLANMAAPPKDTIYAYWRATLLVTQGHTVKILNL